MKQLKIFLKIKILLSPVVFLDLRFLKQLKVGGRLAVFTLYLCLPLKEALFIFLRTLYLLNKHVFPIETTIRKGG